MEYSVQNTGVALMGEIQFFVRLPKGLSEGTPPDGILALSAFYDTAAEVKDFLSSPSSRDKLFQFADEHRYAVVSWPTETIYDNDQSFTQSVQEIRKSEDAFSRTARSWDRGMQLVCNRLRVPYRDILISGVSRGAQWAHRLALRMPEKFLAVHAHVNSSYEEPSKAGKSCLWLISTGNLEHGYESSKEFYRKCQALGYPILYKAQDNLGHGVTPEIQELGVKFFEYALELKSERDKLKEREKSDKMSTKTVPDVGFPPSLLKPFFEPPYVGDLLNEEVYPAARSGEIPESFRVSIPTKDLAKCWGFFSE